MITLDAVITKDSPNGQTVWSDASILWLRYECFVGDVRFKVDEMDFSTDFGWVPTFDFALGMAGSIDRLVVEEEVEFEFTESEAVIRLRRSKNFVDLSASYSTGKKQVPIMELKTAFQEFIHCLGDDLASTHPDLRFNADFNDALRSISTL